MMPRRRDVTRIFEGAKRRSAGPRAEAVPSRSRGRIATCTRRLITSHCPSVTEWRASEDRSRIFEELAAMSPGKNLISPSFYCFKIGPLKSRLNLRDPYFVRGALISIMTGERGNLLFSRKSISPPPRPLINETCCSGRARAHVRRLQPD